MTTTCGLRSRSEQEYEFIFEVSQEVVTSYIEQGQIPFFFDCKGFLGGIDPAYPEVAVFNGYAMVYSFPSLEHTILPDLAAEPRRTTFEIRVSFKGEPLTPTIHSSCHSYDLSFTIVKV